MTFAGDSGAIDHVISKATADRIGIPRKSTPLSKRGNGNEAANGSKIAKVDKLDLDGESETNTQSAWRQMLRMSHGSLLQLCRL